MTTRGLLPVENRIMKSYVRFLNLLASEIGEYCFLFRDQADYGEHAEVVLGQLPTLLNELLSQVASFYSGI
ncbi:MAG: hypothetical protein ACI9FR_003132 [Cryomorphaceae bacterium]|jgi:hypothetical protein